MKQKQEDMDWESELDHKGDPSLVERRREGSGRFNPALAGSPLVLTSPR